jgi:hypothetical protein
MADEKKAPEPRGLGEHTRGLAGEYAHEQGWGLNEEERTRLPEEAQDTDGGTNYDYGARDFGDEPVNTDRFIESEDKDSTEVTNKERI